MFLLLLHEIGRIATIGLLIKKMVKVRQGDMAEKND